MNVKKNYLLSLIILLVSIKEVFAYPVIDNFYNLETYDFEKYEKFCIFNPEEHNYVVVCDYITFNGIHKYSLYDHVNRCVKDLYEYDCLKTKTIESYSNQTQKGIDFIMIKSNVNFL